MDEVEVKPSQDQATNAARNLFASKRFAALLARHHANYAIKPKPEPQPKSPEELKAEWTARQIAIPLPPVSDDAMKEAHALLDCDDSKGKPPQPTVREIQDAVCKYFKIGRLDLISSRRTLKFVRPRMVGVYLSRRLTTRSLPDIGSRFGGRDHSTIIHSLRRMEQMMGTDAEINQAVALLTVELAR